MDGNDKGFDAQGDLARTYRSTAGQPERVDSALTERDLQTLHRDGYVVFERLLAAQQVAEMRAALAPHLTHFGRNPLEGFRTRRTYATMAKTMACNALVEHPRILCLLDQLLMPNYLLSQLQAIEIHPGERAQMLHYDDSFYPIDRPRRHFGVATIWALDAFSEQNGATVVIPRSHTWGQRRPSDDDTPIPVVMPPGSCLVMLGTLWHGGGANRTDASRLAVSAQYCEPWARTQENMFLAIPREVARVCSPSIQRMLGYSIHPPFIGAVDGMSPLRVLDER